MRVLILFYLFMVACAGAKDATQQTFQEKQQSNFNQCMTVMSSQPQKYCGVEIYPFQTGHVFARQSIAEVSQKINKTESFNGCEYITDAVVVVSDTCSLVFQGDIVREITTGPTPITEPPGYGDDLTIGGNLIIQ